MEIILGASAFTSVVNPECTPKVIQSDHSKKGCWPQKKIIFVFDIPHLCCSSQILLPFCFQKRNVVVSSPTFSSPSRYVPKSQFIYTVYIIYLIYRIQIPMAMDYYGKTVDKSDITFEKKARIALATVATFQLIQTLFSRTIKTFPLLIVSHRSLKE